MLHVCTMVCGFLNELYSRPKVYADTQEYWNPIGPDDWARYRQARRARPGSEDELVYTVNYATDANALWIIDQERWKGDRPLYSLSDAGLEMEYPAVDREAKMRGELNWKLETKTVEKGYPLPNSGMDLNRQRRNNYTRRMLPHVLGWFPISAAWTMILCHLAQAKDDLAIARPGVEIPGWVDMAVRAISNRHATDGGCLTVQFAFHPQIYGTVLLFFSFSFVQIIFQYLPPGFYWGTEILYCILSLSAKMYLGLFLLINVIFIDGTAEGALAGVDDRLERVQNL